ncbi:hypothetical protein NCS57_00280800 [Fusarium keratoplasticum]|uniref:Uncharacterized protein n=1 Tax=Fusarium keratoplasticum TaxID=1328300 RepID=A0ACC0RBW6_9HYPO|nr:hypothetical protein NCS57_00280800 [Fusarium keratoplasticum]KAI8680011.1 hypothetical protein NCS57_00280800 [Fusarium keratoplasticum]KAI8686092.1 hypothetical protein NCS55_00283700 [Fusarium keratoplasticum]
MFRRRWSGLPKDASFASDLEGLGYFVNDEDEIRSIENPDCYYKFFISKNMRVNERQRFHFNGAIQDIIHDRLMKKGLLRIPLGTDEKYCPIFISPKTTVASRIIVILGEPIQNVGMLAGRVASGPGGLTKGSIISVLRAIAKQKGTPKAPCPPSVVLANMGERHWWPEGKRSITVADSTDIPLPSLVHTGRKYIKELNEIPGSETAAAHMATVFKNIAEWNDIAKIDVIAIGESCEVALKFFEDKENWDKWGDRMGGMLMFGTVYNTEKLTNDGFKKFLAERTRAYLVSPEPLDTPLATTRGNPSLSIEPLGCPCLSSGEPHYVELIAIRALEPALAYLQEIALTKGFVNPEMAVAERPPTDFTDEDWSKLPEENKPGVVTLDQEEMKKRIKELRRWKKFEETGEAPDWDTDDEEEEELPQGSGKENWHEGDAW